MAQVQVYQEQVWIPTYEILSEDPNPFFDKYLDPYPYTQQNHFSKEKVLKSYHAVMLENEYFRMMVLPELGGRLHSVWDKRANREMFYRNAVIKPRLVATRGAWYSGGIEFNFPISHSPHTMDRVNVQIKQYEDGSGSVIFGNIEQISFLSWRVELRLYPGQASIEQNVKLYNPAKLEQRYYFWTNAAVQIDDRARLVYPFDWGVNNISPEYVKWPMFGGNDCSIAKCVPYAFETFGKLPMNNYFGIYSEAAKYGIVHYADRKKLKGAKFFTWGNDSYADAWNRSLTDDDSAYIEIQSGPFESQTVYKFLKPHQTVEWSEYWYAIPELDGLHYAEKDVALSCKIREQSIDFRLMAVRSLAGCELKLVVGGVGGQTCRQTLDLSAEHASEVSFEIEGQLPKHQFCLEISYQGEIILALGEQKESLPEPPDLHSFEDIRVVRQPGLEGTSKLDLGQYEESFGLLGKASSSYEAYLQENPRCTATLYRLGQIYLKQLRVNDAISCFTQLLRIDNRCSKARYLLGVAEQMAGRPAMARKLFEDIAADSEVYESSLIEWIKTDIALDNYYAALRHIRSSGIQNPYLELLQSICERKLAVAVAVAAAAEPGVASEGHLLEEYLLAERWLKTNAEEDRTRLAVYTGGDERVLLPIALFYSELALYEDASRVLGQVLAPGLKSALAQLMFEQEKRSPDSLASLTAKQIEEALHCPLDHVFLNEAPLATFLIHVSDLDGSGRIDYLLGTYFYSIERQEEALRYSLSSYHKGLRYTVLLRNLGYMYIKNLGDAKTATMYLKDNLHCNGGSNADTLLLLDQIYKETGDLDGRTALIPYMEAVGNRAKVLVQLTEIYIALHRYERAYEILSSEEFENGEGAELSGPCWREAALGLARKALSEGKREEARTWADLVDQYPKKLNYGDSVRNSLAKVCHERGMIYAQIGDESAAVEQFRIGAAELGNAGSAWIGYDPVAAGNCLEQLKKRFLI